MATKAVLTISSKNYGAWALRGWLMARFSGLDFNEHIIPPDDAAMKGESEDALIAAAPGASDDGKR